MPPQPLARRDVLRTAAALGIASAAVLAPEETLAQQGGLAPSSGLVTGQPRPLKYESIPGLLSKEQIAPHYNAHYGGALRRYLKIEEDLAAQLSAPQPVGGDAHAFLVRDRLNRMNSVLLHELYFEGLMPQAKAPGEALRGKLAARFGTFDRWQEDFRATCMSANGWGMLVRDLVNGKLYNVASDLHEIGVIWLGQPLLACDVYEHAFYVDYQNRKKDYVDRFLSFVDWDEIGKRHALLDRFTQ